MNNEEFKYLYGCLKMMYKFSTGNLKNDITEDYYYGYENGDLHRTKWVLSKLIEIKRKESKLKYGVKNER